MNSQRVIGLVVHGMACVLYIVMNGFAVPIYKTLVGGLTSRGVAIGMGMYLVYYFFVFLNLVLVFIPRLAAQFGVAIFMMVSILVYLLPRYPVRAMAYCTLAGGLTLCAILVTRALNAAFTRWRAAQGVARSPAPRAPVKHPLAKGLAVAVAVVTAILAWATPVFSNAFMLLMDRANFIPRESSIWTFEPYEINQGSSNYWLYGEDAQRYYYFAYTPDAPYRSIAKRNQCAGFDKRDVHTWCTP